MNLFFQEALMDEEEVKEKKKKSERCEWVITYTPPGGGIGHSRALSWYAPNILHDHDALEEVRARAKEVVAAQLDNPEHPQYICRMPQYPYFGLAWIEKYTLDEQE